MFKISISLLPATSAHKRARLPWIAAAASLAALPVLATASPLSVPNSFEDGDIIDADAFNENFEAIAEAVGDNDTRISSLEGGDAGVPPGAVMFFNLNECPEGWSELEEARGRALVGMNGSAGTLLGEVGGALEDLEQVSHGHTIAGGSSVTTSTSSVPHTHGSGSYGTNSTGSHNHQWKDGLSTYAANGQASAVPPFPYGSGTYMQMQLPQNADYFTDNDGSHSHDVTGTSGSSSATNHSHTVSIGGQAVAATTTSLPYLQLLACQRSQAPENDA